MSLRTGRNICVLAISFLMLILAAACGVTGNGSEDRPVDGESPESGGSRGGTDREPISRMESAYLGTVISIAVHDTDVDESAIAALLDDCFTEIAGIDARMSVNKDSSEVSEINRNSGGEYIAVSNELYELIGSAVSFSERSGGAFDISVGPVMELWKLDGEFARLPSPDEIREKLPLVNYNMIELEAPNRVRLSIPGMSLDLGAIAKGYACDRVTDMLRAAGVKHAVIDMGGNIYVVGGKLDGSDWRVGIRTPLAGENGIVCRLQLKDATAVTSGGYERFFEDNGRVYNHLLDTKTGYPADSGLLSVTIVADSSSGADAYSTSCFILGLEKGMALIEGSGFEGIFITNDMKVHVTPGLADAVEVVDERFEAAE
ncbi:MAG: FAD:protein FMN transferase [Clostridiales Family XIII bacterium]|jgi:thiamine biosynthesis lipoprotein|nr:FAD:protein FMN transferase [Clostridiales Family XIII bacterium]